MKEYTSTPEILCYIMGSMFLGYALRSNLPVTIDIITGVALVASFGFFMCGLMMRVLMMRQMEEPTDELTPIPPPTPE